MLSIVVFFFTHETACEIRISDWSSYVSSSDLLTFVFPACAAALLVAGCASTGGLAPREHPIEADSLASGRSLDVPALSDAAFPARDWWTALGDPQLDAMVREALSDSP